MPMTASGRGEFWNRPSNRATSAGVLVVVAILTTPAPTSTAKRILPFKTESGGVFLKSWNEAMIPTPQLFASARTELIKPRLLISTSTKVANGRSRPNSSLLFSTGKFPAPPSAGCRAVMIHDFSESGIRSPSRSALHSRRSQCPTGPLKAAELSIIPTTSGPSKVGHFRLKL